MRTLIVLLSISFIANASVQTLSGELAESEFVINFNASDIDNMEQSPRILFSKSELPKLRQWVVAPKMKPIWQEVLAKAEGYCDSQSKDYVSTEWVADMPGSWLAMHGRHLSSRLEIIGLAYHITGDEKFARHGAALLTEAAVSLPTTHSGIARGKALGGARGDMLRVFATGLDLFDCALSAQQRRTIHKTAIEYLEGIYEEEGGTAQELYAKGGGSKRVADTVLSGERARVHNFSAVIWGAAGALAFHFLDTEPIMAENIITLSNAIVVKYIYDAYPDGSAMEGTSYVGYAFSNIFLLADALRTAGLSDIYKHPNLPKLVYFHAMSLLPGEDVFDPRSSADYNSGSTITMLKLARELAGDDFDEQTKTHGRIASFFADFGVGSSAMRILYENNTQPLNPADADLPTDAYFKRRGLVIFRTGWQAEDLMFAIEAGEHHPGSHGYADNGHITLYGLGRRWLRDPGTRNHPTHFFNNVLIDGIGQGLSGRGYGTSGKITDYRSERLYGYCRADLTEAYKQGGSPGREVPGLDVENVLRHSFFIRKTEKTPAYTVFLDDIGFDEKKHNFTWQFHSSSEMQARQTENGIIIEPVDAIDDSYIASYPDKGQGFAGWRFNIEQSGDYTIWARVKAHRDRHFADRIGSFVVQLDNERGFDWLIPTTWQQQWIWAPVRQADFKLPQLPPDLGDDLHRHVAHGDEETLAQIGQNWHNFKSLRRYFPQRDILAQPFNLQKGAHTLRFMTRTQDVHTSYLDAVVVCKDLQAKPPFDFDSDDVIVLPANEARVSSSMERVKIESKPQPQMLVAAFADEPLEFIEDTFLFRPRFSFNTKADNPRFAVVLIPMEAGGQTPQISYNKDKSGSLLTVEWDSHTDTIRWETDITAVARFKTYMR